MNKIPTMYKRDPDDRKHVLPEIHPDCLWVADGEGVATRKYEGTSVMKDEKGFWWARREVKKGKERPDNYLYISTDPISEAQMGYEPIEQSGYYEAFDDAMIANHGHTFDPGTYELIGPKINGNPEKTERHDLRMHKLAETVNMQGMVRDFETIKKLVIHLGDVRGWEGIVFHHPDGRMAKIKRRDFPA